MDYFNIIFIGEKIIYQICNLRNLVVKDWSKMDIGLSFLI